MSMTENGERGISSISVPLPTKYLLISGRKGELCSGDTSIKRSKVPSPGMGQITGGSHVVRRSEDGNSITPVLFLPKM